MGELAINLCYQTQAISYLVDSVPTLFMIHLTMKKFTEAAALLTKFYSNAKFCNNSEDLTWYYALSMDYLINVGRVIETFETCKEFCMREIVEHGKIEHESQLRLIANLLVFHGKIKIFNKIQEDVRPIQKLLKTVDKTKWPTLDHMFTLLRFYEHGHLRPEIKAISKSFPKFLKLQLKWQMQCEESKMPSQSIIEKLKAKAIKHRNYHCHDEIISFEIMHKEHAV